jgi:hypothetical protein
MERKRNKGQGPKSRQANSPKKASHKEVRKPLNVKISISHLKHITKERGGKLNKTPTLKEPSLAIITDFKIEAALVGS